MLCRYWHNIHSTGHRKRLNRFENNEISAFNSSNLGKEKLTTEIGVAFLNGFTEILNDDTWNDSFAYIKSWLNKLRNYKNL